MEKRQVLLIHMLPLFGEGLRRIFQRMDDVELVSLECVELPEIEACLQDFHPQMVVLAGEKETDRATHLISWMLKKYEGIPIVWVELESNILRLYTSRTMTANSTALINAIRENDPGEMEIYPLENKTRTGSRRDCP